MRAKLPAKLSMIVAIFAATLLVTSTHIAAQQYKILHDFENNNRGMTPYTELIFDTSGNLYGTTYDGGALNAGTVFRLSANGSGGWTPTVLHSFGSGADGAYVWGGVIMDGSGNLYGVTQFGGTGVCSSAPAGCGIVYELSPNGSGGYTERVLYSFNASGANTDGMTPSAGLVMDGSGNLYGTTISGGISNNGGTVFELQHTASGWKEKVLHSFGNGTDGSTPQCILTLDASGNVYGTTVLGGTRGSGIVFELQHTLAGWKEKVVFDFSSDTTGYSGIGPVGGVIFDTSGNLYGTTEFGGSTLWGNVYELSPAAGGTWTVSVLHSFARNDVDGNEPQANLIFDTAGNLYSTTFGGGGGKAGTVFKLAPAGGGVWNETLLHDFQDNGKDGNFPNHGLVLDTQGNLYGTTPDGGPGGTGTVFEITP